MKKRIFSLAISFLICITFMPNLTFASEGSLSFQCNIVDVGITKVEYKVGLDGETKTITGTGTVYVPTGSTVYYTAYCSEAYTFGEDTSNPVSTYEGVEYNIISTTISFTLTKLPVDPVYELPESLTIKDKNGNDIPSNSGENWVITDRGDIVGYALKVYVDDAVISGTFYEAIELYADKATISDLTIPLEAYRSIDICNEKDNFNLTIEGECTASSLSTSIPNLVIAGNGTLKARGLDSYYEPYALIQIYGCTLELESIAYLIDMKGVLNVFDGKVHLNMPREDYEVDPPIAELDGIGMYSGYTIKAKSRFTGVWTKPVIVDRHLVIEEADGTYSNPREVIIQKETSSGGGGGRNLEPSEEIKAEIEKYKAEAEKYKAEAEEAKQALEKYQIPAKVTSKVKALGKGKIKISWAKVKDATTYQISYKRAGKNAKSIKVNSKYSAKTIKKLAKGKKYTIKVRAIKKVDSAYIYGKWSNTKTVKVK